jgi:hypothetical protein
MTTHLNQLQGHEHAERSKKRRLTVAMVAVGFVVTVVLYASIAFTRTSDPPSRLEIGLGVISLVLCPPSVLYTPMFDIDPYSIPGATIWLAIGLINSGLYASLGWLVGRLLWRSR